MAAIDSFDFNGHTALIRVDFNVPVDSAFRVTDDTRIIAAIPTIKKVLNGGGAVVLMSHFGRPKSGPEEKYSLKHILPVLSDRLGKQVKFADDCISDDAFEMSSNLEKGEVLLLENLRFYEEESSGDHAFSQKLSLHGTVYINDAFGTAHRAHASTTIVANYMENKMFGYLMNAEVENGYKVLHNAQHPYTAVIGGAKVSSKIDVITNLLDKIDNLIIGGGMAYTFIKAKGGAVGSSLVELDHLTTALQILEIAEQKGVNLLLPEDSVVADAFSNEANLNTLDSGQIPDGWMGLDVGPKAIKAYEKVIKSSKTILWNGPLGVFEMSSFEQGTRALGEMIAASSAYSLVGGGDSVAAVKKFGLEAGVSYVSTGGGALLELLEGKELPGVAAIGYSSISSGTSNS